MTRRDRFEGLQGLRLALYDEALSAGPRGLLADELAAATHDDAQRMGLLPTQQQPHLAWLVEAGWLVEYQAGRYRAVPKEIVATLPESERAAAEPPRQHHAPATRPPAPTPPRQPLFAPRSRHEGQLGLF